MRIFVFCLYLVCVLFYFVMNSQEGLNKYAVELSVFPKVLGLSFEPGTQLAAGNRALNLSTLRPPVIAMPKTFA